MLKFNIIFSWKYNICSNLILLCSVIWKCIKWFEKWKSKSLKNECFTSLLLQWSIAYRGRKIEWWDRSAFLVCPEYSAFSNFECDTFCQLKNMLQKNIIFKRKDILSHKNHIPKNILPEKKNTVCSHQTHRIYCLLWGTSR